MTYVLADMKRQAAVVENILWCHKERVAAIVDGFDVLNEPLVFGEQEGQNAHLQKSEVSLAFDGVGKGEVISENLESKLGRQSAPTAPIKRRGRNHGRHFSDESHRQNFC